MSRHSLVDVAVLEVGMRCPRCRGERRSPFAHEHAFIVKDLLPGQLHRQAVVGRHRPACSLCRGMGWLSRAMIDRFNSGR